MKKKVDTTILIAADMPDSAKQKRPSLSPCYSGVFHFICRASTIDDNGVVLSACRYLDVSVENIELPLSLSSRHMAAASISQQTDCVAIAVFESSIVRIFIDRQIVSEIIPEIWLLKRYSTHLEGPYLKRNFDEMAVLDKENV